jgi:brefeldin A-inhibited guanine nucleotide-exchange protein
VGEDKAVADPPLLRLEVEAASAVLSVTLSLTLAAAAATQQQQAAARGSVLAAPPDAAALAALTNAPERLVALCLTTLWRYTQVG